MLNRAHQVDQPRISLKQFGAQVKNYATLVIWLLRSSFRGRIKKLLFASAMNLAYLAAQGIAIGVIYWYARQMQGGDAAQIPWVADYITLSSQTLLWLVVAVAAMAFIASAVFIFLARTTILRIVEAHLGQSLEKLVRLTMRLPDPRARLASRVFAEHGLGPLVAGCKRGALTAVVFSNAISGMFGGLTAAAFLFWIDPALTTLILFLVCLGTLFLYPVALYAVTLFKQRIQAQLAFRREVLTLQQGGDVSGPIETPGKLANVHVARRQLKNQFMLRTEIAMAVIFSIVVLYLANQSMGGSTDWAFFIAYIGALRLVLSASTLVIRAFTSVTRFYPSIVRYYLVQKDLEGIDQRPFATVQPGDRLRLGALRTGEEIYATTGDRFAVVAANPKSDLALALLHARRDGSDLPLKTEFVTPRTALSGETAVAILDTTKFAEGHDLQALTDALKQRVTLIVRPEAKELGTLGEEQLLTALDGEFWRNVPLGTSECEAALKEFRSKSAKAARRKRFVDDEDEEEEL